jgi:hypothetical protein
MTDVAEAPAEVTVEVPAVAVETAVVLHTEVPSLLEGVGQTPEVTKPAEVAAEPADVKAEPVGAKEDAKPVDPVSEVKVTEPVSLADYKFELPGGVEPDPASMSIYRDVLTKHNMSAEVGQELLNLHATAIAKLGTDTLAQQHASFADVRKTWRTQVMSDEKIGGAGHQTAMSAIARVRDMAVPAEDRAAFDDFLRVTGAGDHPAFLKAFHNLARIYDEPKIPAVRGTPAPQPNTPANRRGVLYNHPTSTQSGR